MASKYLQVNQIEKLADTIGETLAAMACLGNPDADKETQIREAELVASRVFDAAEYVRREALTVEKGRRILVILCKEVLTYLGVKATYETRE